MGEPLEHSGSRGPQDGKRPRLAHAAVVLGALGISLVAVTAAGAMGASKDATRAVTIGTSQGLASINPEKATLYWELMNRRLMFSALTRYTPTGGTKIQPDIARTWRASADLKTYTFEIREGLKFWNGKPLTARVALKTFRRLTKGTRTPYELTGVQSVSAPNERTLVFRLKQPSVSFPTKMATIFIIDPATINAKPGPVGSGPWKVSDYVPDDHLTLVPNSSYYGGAPVASRLNIINTHDPTAAVTGLRAGNIDAAFQLPFAVVDPLIKDGKFRLITPPKGIGTTWVFYTQIDVTSEPFNDVRARRALSYALDRKTMASAAWYDHARPAFSSQPVPPGNETYAKGLPNYQYDLEKAKSLFNQAGIREGAKLTWWGIAPVPESKLVGQILQQSLATIGINLEIQEVDVPTWAAKIYPPPKKYPNIISINGLQGPYPDGFAEWWLTNRTATNWKNAAFTRAVTQVDRTANVAKRKQLYATAQRIFAREQPAQCFVYFDLVYVRRAELKGVWVDRTGFGHFEEAHY